jgi:hypothetical protein
MKKVTVLLGVFLLFAVVGFQFNSATATVYTEVAVIDDCSLDASEISELQHELADEEQMEYTYVVSQTIDISYTSCDGSLATAGTITLDIGNVPSTWNWTFERLGGGDNIIVIWPAS